VSPAVVKGGGASVGIIGRRQRIFFRLVDRLRAVEADRENMVLLKDFNGLIIRAVIKTERDIIRHKARAKALKISLRSGRQTREQSNEIRRQIAATKTRVERYEDQMYLWKLFGDSLAHLYLDKFAIKHTFYDTETYTMKPGAGMINGKEGFIREVGLMLDALAHDVPAMLCDCTNVLRYGDVCLLGNNDPYLIEVKSSNKLNQRGKRQAANLARLQDFLDTDKATNFRGNVGEVRRHAIQIPEIIHVDRLNEAIDAAALDGGKAVSPERGLNYVALYVGGDQVAISGMVMEPGVMVYDSWNDAKNGRAWGYYVPFLLTIRDPQRLLDFIEGRLIIMVYLNADVLVELMTRSGWKAIFREEGDYAVLCQHIESGGVIGLSRQMVTRIFFECSSLEWMARSQILVMEEQWQIAKDLYGPDFPFDQHEHVERSFGVPYDVLMAAFQQAGVNGAQVAE